MATYNIHLNMVKVQEWKINLSQATLFDLYSKAYSWATEVVDSGLTFYWCARTKVIEEIPVLTDKPDTVYRLTKELAAAGLIMYKRIDGKDCIRITEKGKTWNSEKNPNKEHNSENYPNQLGKKSETDSEKNPTYNSTSKDNSTRDNKKYTHTRSSHGELFETTLKAEKQNTPPVAAAPPIEPPDYYDLPNPLNQFQKAYNAWVKERELTHGKFKYVQQESQLIAFVNFCTRNNLNQSAFFEHCLLCAIGGDWKNLNPELAKRSFMNNKYTPEPQQKSTYDRKFKGYE